MFWLALVMAFFGPILVGQSYGMKGFSGGFFSLIGFMLVYGAGYIMGAG